MMRVAYSYDRQVNHEQVVVEANHAKFPLFYSKAGKLKPYAFACGYFEHESVGNDPYVRISIKMEHGVYHVRGISSLGEFEYVNAFSRLGDARHAFRNVKRDATTWLLSKALGH